MNVLLDTCVWGGAKVYLQAKACDVICSNDWANDPGDDEILKTAHQEGRILVTLDKDFGELAVVYSRPHSGIVRLVNIPARQQGEVSYNVIQTHLDELKHGAIITVTNKQVRIRLSDSTDSADES